MKNILEELCEQRRQDAKLRRQRLPESELMARARQMPPVEDFAAAFEGPGIHVIAELKKASPSAGVIRDKFDPRSLAQELASSGAAALSVLCEPHRFLGSERFLTEVATVTSLPLLYKDFVTTPYQVAAARVAGASAVLLIVAALEDRQLRELISLVRELGFSALVETHDEAEIDRAMRAGAKIVGVNCRDLRTFATDPTRTLGLLGRIPNDRVRIAESGLHRREELQALQAAGADGFLIGTALMRSARPGAELTKLITQKGN